MDKERASVSILRDRLRQLQDEMWTAINGWQSYMFTPEQLEARINILSEERADLESAIAILTETTK